MSLGVKEFKPTTWRVFQRMQSGLRRYLGVIEAPNEVRALETALRHFRIHVPADVRRVFLEKREDV
jgi:hypothetical protein